MTQRISTGVTDQYIYFTAPTGLSTFTVYGARNGAAAAAFTTPTVAEVDGTNMPGLYSLLLDEQTTMTAGNITEILSIFIKASGWAGTHVQVELVNPVAMFQQQLTESYAADGSAPTVEQALMLIQQALTEFSISGTTLTIKKIDGSTTAATGTLSDATSPTSITRAS